jgi:methionine-rich copper-binding protein CopC
MRTMKSVATIFVALLTLATQAALAHTHLKSSSPVDGSTVTTPPKQLTLTFEDFTQVTAVSIAGKDGKAKTLEVPAAGPSKTATVALPALKAGDYLVRWRAAGHDGHVMSGQLKFTVAAASAK